MTELSEKLYVIFCENVRRRMKGLGITQTGLAERMAVTDSFVSSLLNGRRKPGLATLASVALALETDANKLIEEQ